MAKEEGANKEEQWVREDQHAGEGEERAPATGRSRACDGEKGPAMGRNL